jgi:hypothetical protein
MASGMFRLMAALGRDTVVANTLAAFALVITLVLSGFILSHGEFITSLKASLLCCYFLTAFLVLCEWFIYI